MRGYAIVFSLICFFAFESKGQLDIIAREKQLRSLLDSLRTAQTDSLRITRNDAFKDLLAKTLQDPVSFLYAFSQLKSIGTIESPDNMIRIINWNVELEDQSQLYFSYVLKYDPRKKNHKVIELRDNIDIQATRTDEILDAEHWYGALYYQIVPVLRNGKTVYTLLGWEGYSTLSTIKLIDIMSFSGNGVRFGAPMFKINDEVKKRVYLEHSQQATMTLRWEESLKRIMFDHLSPETPTLKGFYQYYVPDMSYDALEFHGNKWVLIEDVIGINTAAVKVKLNSIDEKTNEVVTEEIDSKWIDPSRGGSPQNTHAAALPDNAPADDKKVKGKTKPVTALDTYDPNKRSDKKTKAGSKINPTKRRRK